MQKELTTFPPETQWIEKLALEEVNMEESGVVHFNNHLNPRHLLEESSINLMDQLKELFQVYVNSFNQFRSQNGERQSCIKIFKIANTANDFMLYRNSLKLICARRNYDLINIGFLSNSGGLFAARLNFNEQAQNKPHEIKADFGAFNKINWSFEGQDIDLKTLAQHYLTEFIKHTAK
jgi:hypothetical protein